MESLQLFLSVSRFHIVAIAALGTLTFSWVFSGEHVVWLALASAFDWFVVNLLNRVVDLREDKKNGITGTGFVEQNSRWIAWLGFGLLFASFPLTFVLSAELTALRVCYHALGFAYNWAILPGKKRIKELYFFKNFASATGFVLTVFLYPLAYVHALGSAFPDGITTAVIVATIAFFLLFEISYEVIYDLRDVEGDVEAGIRTFPAVHGEAVAVRIVDGLLVGAILIAVIATFAISLPIRIAVMVVAPVAQLFLYKVFVARGITSAHCISLTWVGAGLLALYNTWVLFELPLTHL